MLRERAERVTPDTAPAPGPSSRPSPCDGCVRSCGPGVDLPSGSGARRRAPWPASIRSSRPTITSSSPTACSTDGSRRSSPTAHPSSSKPRRWRPGTSPGVLNPDGTQKMVEMSGLSTAAGQKVEEFSLKSKTFDAMRTGLLRPGRASQGHGHRRRRRAGVLPDAARPRRAHVHRDRRQALRLGADARVQRLADRGMVRARPGAPARRGDPAAVGHGGVRRGDPPHRVRAGSSASRCRRRPARSRAWQGSTTSRGRRSGTR